MSKSESGSPGAATIRNVFWLKRKGYLTSLSLPGALDTVPTSRAISGAHTSADKLLARVALASLLTLITTVLLRIPHLAVALTDVHLWVRVGSRHASGFPNFVPTTLSYVVSFLFFAAGLLLRGLVLVDVVRGLAALEVRRRITFARFATRPALLQLLTAVIAIVIPPLGSDSIIIAGAVPDWLYPGLPLVVAAVAVLPVLALIGTRVRSRRLVVQREEQARQIASVTGEVGGSQYHLSCGRSKDNALGLSPVPAGFPCHGADSAEDFARLWLDLYLTGTAVSDSEFELLVAAMTDLIVRHQGEGGQELCLALLGSPASPPIAARATSVPVNEAQTLALLPAGEVVSEYELAPALANALAFERVVAVTTRIVGDAGPAGASPHVAHEEPDATSSTAAATQSPVFTARAVAWTPTVTVLAEAETTNPEWGQMLSEGLAFFVSGVARVEPPTTAH